MDSAELPICTLDIVGHLVHSVRVQPGGLKVRKRTGRIAIAAVIAALLAGVYSTGLGFGVNERCDSLAPGTDCSRLNWMALLHAGVQVVLVIAAGIVGVSVWRASSGWRRSALIAAVAVVYVCLVVTAVVVYTDAAWNWANSRAWRRAAGMGASTMASESFEAGLNGHGSSMGSDGGLNETKR